MSYNLGIHVGLACNFWVEKFNKDGVNFKTGPFRNTILNSGLDLLYTTGIHCSAHDEANVVERCNIGTGTTAPAVTQTGLDTYFTSVQWDSVVSKNNEVASPLRCSAVNMYQFNIGTFNGENIGELGLSRADNTDYFNRQLTRVTTSVVDENIGTGDGSATNFTGSLTNGSCDDGTLVITAYDTGDNLMTLTDDGAGGFTGNGSGTIIYDSGAFDVTFNTAVKNGNNVLADYDWQEPTTITVAADEGLRIYAQIIVYAEGELNTNIAKSAFTFTNITDSTSVSPTYNLQVNQFNFVGWRSYINATDIYLASSIGATTTLADSISRSLTTAAAGGPYADIEGTWNPGTWTGDIEFITVQRYGGGGYYFTFGIQLDTPISSIIDTEEIKITARVSWGRY